MFDRMMFCLACVRAASTGKVKVVFRRSAKNERGSEVRCGAVL